MTNYYVEFPTKIFSDRFRRRVPWFAALRDLEKVFKKDVPRGRNPIDRGYIASALFSSYLFRYLPARLSPYLGRINPNRIT